MVEGRRCIKEYDAITETRGPTKATAPSSYTREEVSLLTRQTPFRSHARMPYPANQAYENPSANSLERSRTTLIRHNQVLGAERKGGEAIAVHTLLSGCLGVFKLTV
jgi:hypothetical protein